MTDLTPEQIAEQVISVSQLDGESLIILDLAGSAVELPNNPINGTTEENLAYLRDKLALFIRSIQEGKEL